jgi:hypothetical protein
MRVLRLHLEPLAPLMHGDTEQLHSQLSASFFAAASNVGSQTAAYDALCATSSGRTRIHNFARRVHTARNLAYNNNT